MLQEEAVKKEHARKLTIGKDVNEKTVTIKRRNCFMGLIPLALERASRFAWAREGMAEIRKECDEDV